MILFRRTKVLPHFVEVRSSGLAYQPEGLPCIEGGIYPARACRITSGIGQQHPTRKADRDSAVTRIRTEWRVL